MKKFSEFATEPMSLRVVDFRDPSPNTLETVDFRSIKESGFSSALDAEPWVKHLREKGKENDPVHGRLYDQGKRDKVHNAVKNYTKGSAQLNSHLFKTEGNPKESFHEKIGHIDKYASSKPSPADFHAYSGLHKAPKPGLHIHHGYMSTSLDPGVAEQFAKGPDTHILKLHIKKGTTHGAYLEPHTKMKGEREFLVGRGKHIHIHPEPEKHAYFGKTVHVWHGDIVDGEK
jgi:hypothetical protein